MRKSNYTDDMLIKAMREDNDMLSFEILFERYAERLNSFALKYVQRPEVAEELMMDVMLWLWQHREQANEIGQLAPYLFKAIRNKVFDYLRKNALKTVPIESLPDRGNQLIDSDKSHQHLELAELREQYNKTLKSLPPQCKKVFELSREQELSHSEISSMLNISTKTVEGHITNALKVMRRNLPPSGVAYLLMVYFLF